MIPIFTAGYSVVQLEVVMALTLARPDVDVSQIHVFHGDLGLILAANGKKTFIN